jgi:predicted small lipoprotein YifL
MTHSTTLRAVRRLLLVAVVAAAAGCGDSGPTEKVPSDRKETKANSRTPK